MLHPDFELATQAQAHQLTIPTFNQNIQAQIQAENKVHSFSNDLFGNLTVLVIDNEPWFIAKEVTDRLEYPEAFDAIRILCPDRRKVTYKYLKRLQTRTGPNTVLNISKFKKGCLIISRVDVFALIDGSGKPEAKVMKEWLNHHVLPTLQDTGTYTMITHPNPQPAQPISQSSEAALILQEMSKMIMGIIQTVTDSTVQVQQRMEQTLERVERNNQALLSTFTNTMITTTDRMTSTIQNTIVDNTSVTEESKWARKGTGRYNTSQIARLLKTSAVRLNSILHREGLITTHPTNDHWIMTNKGFDFAYYQQFASRPKKYVSNMGWDISLVEYLKRNVAEFHTA